MPQENLLDLINLVLTTTWYTFNSHFYHQNDDIAMVRPVSSNTGEMYMHVHDETAIFMALHPPKV